MNPVIKESCLEKQSQMPATTTYCFIFKKSKSHVGSGANTSIILEGPWNAEWFGTTFMHDIIVIPAIALWHARWYLLHYNRHKAGQYWTVFRKRQPTRMWALYHSTEPAELRVRSTWCEQFLSLRRDKVQLQGYSRRYAKTIHSAMFQYNGVGCLKAKRTQTLPWPNLLWTYSTHH